MPGLTAAMHARRYDAHTGVEHVGKGGTTKVGLSLDSIPAWLAGGRILPFQERPRRSSVAMAVRSRLQNETLIGFLLRVQGSARVWVQGRS